MKAKPKKYKVGQTVTMEFHMYGLVSKTKQKIIHVDGDIIMLNTNEDPNRCFRFHASTGTCINDVTWGGASRRLKI